MRFVFFICFLGAFNLLAQPNPTIDSLIRIYNTLSSDKEKAAMLAKLSAAYKNVNITKSRQLAQEGIELSRKSADTSSEVLCVIQLALLDRDEGRFVVALSRLKEILNKVQKNSDRTLLSRCYISIGDVYSVLENYNEAIKYYDQSIELNKKYFDRENLVIAMNRKGNRFMDQGRKLNDTLLFLKAINLYKETEKAAANHVIDKHYVNTIVSLADAYNILGKYTGNKHHLYQSLNYSMRSLTLGKQIYSKEYEGISYLNLGEVYLSLGKEMKALYYFDLAEKIYEDLHNLGWLLNTEAFLAKTYYSLHLYEKAIEHATEAINLAKAVKNKHYLFDNYQLMSDILYKQKKFDEALYYNKLYSETKDSVLNETNSFDILRLQAELDLERKNYEIGLLTKNTELQNQKIYSQGVQRNYLLIGICVLLILLVFTIYLYNERRKGLRDLLRAKLIAEQAKEAQEQFLANTSHEIRTPMNGIIGMTNHLMETPLNPQQIEYVSIIKESSNNLLNLINELLDLSKIIARKIIFESKELDLRETVKGIVRLLEFKTKEKNIEIIFDVDAKIPNTIIGDQARLKQILLNLVDNAVKFTKEGKIRILVKLISETLDNIELQFDIEDTGIGIPENKLNLIFETFTQVNAKANRKHSGTGLGLAITKQLIEQQDGTITVTSRLNVGSVFRFNLKFKKVIVLNNEEYNHQISYSVFPEANLTGYHILIVDDNKINQQVAHLTLKKWHANIKVASSAKEAFELLEKLKFDLVLMDVSMPDVDGFEATRQIRKNSNPQIANIPIIAITAAAFLDDKNKCFAAGMNDYISKPFKPDDLLNKLLLFLPDKLPLEQVKICDLTILKERAAGDTDFLREILESYIQEMPIYVAEMELYLNNQDWEEVGKQAHKMKTPLALMGATNLNKLYSEIELQSSSNTDKDSLMKQIHYAQNLCLQTIDELKQELKTIN